MEVLLRDFLTDQIFGLSGLANLSNFAVLLAFSVRDVLKLRVLALASDVMIVPYYYFQHKPLWPPIFWGMAFVIVNGVRTVTLILERRPVILSDREEELHRVAFGSVDKRDFIKMASLARWVDVSPGEVIVKKGRQISDAIVLISGETEAVLSGKTIFAYRPGQLIGNVSAYSGLASPADVVARGPARLAKWDLEHMREFTESRPKLRAKLLKIMSHDLAAKLHENLTNQGHS
ncbi:MAG TPA: cyclic nucleotide-binding domain-containing protein [Alphaproteobacteria bacterium]